MKEIEYLSEADVSVSSIPAQQSATLTPGNGAQFSTSAAVQQALLITNNSVQETAYVQLNCSSWASQGMQTIAPYGVYRTSAIFGGAPLVISNLTSPNNPATISVTLNTVA